MLPCRVLLGTAALLTLTSAASAQPGGFPGGPPGGGFGGGFPGGPFMPPQPGQILSTFQQEQLKLTANQKKDLETLQKEVDAKLAKVLTTDQKKQLENMRKGPGGFGPPGGGFGPGGPGGKFGPGGGFGPPGGGFGPPGFGPPGGGFGGNPLDNVKKQLDATDEEWKVISTKLQKVISARQALTGAGGGFGIPGGGTSRVGQARAELKTVLDDPKHTPAEVTDHIAAVRKAQQQARADLDAAQKDLVQMLTARQEAVLVSLGYLD
jgi:Spy/CpxP family protein refolding chaperone